MMPGNYADVLEYGATYELDVCEWRLRAFPIGERGTLIAWFLQNTDSSKHSLWLTPTGALAIAHDGMFPFGTPTFTAGLMYIQKPGWEPETADFYDLTLVAKGFSEFVTPVAVGNDAPERSPFEQEPPQSSHTCGCDQRKIWWVDTLQEFRCLNCEGRVTKPTKSGWLSFITDAPYCNEDSNDDLDLDVWGAAF